MIRALLFDLGNVLIYFSHERMCRQIGELVGRSGEEVWRLLMGSAPYVRYETGAISTIEFARELERLFDRQIDPAALSRAASDIFWRNESIEPVIEQLAARGYPLVLLSNTCDMHHHWVDERFAVLRHFERRALSYQVGACKPQPEIYHAAASLAGVALNECFFTDDTPGHVAAARQLGIDAVVYRDTQQLVAQLQRREITLSA
jgi:putative hydrolase of the HAD superfamily